LAGGTGLYLRAVARGLPLADLPNDPMVRDRLEAELVTGGLARLVERLHAVAPILARDIETSNPRRVLRALEIAELRGDGPRPVPRGYDGPMAWLGLDLERDQHAERIAGRARRQFVDGLLEEAIVLRDRFDPGLPCFSAIGYHEAWSLADGTTTLEGAIARVTERTVAFAKRQRTWFRSEREISWLDVTSNDPLPAALAVLAPLIQRIGG
ncbi:MAG: tRNA dimethylallyltransferase, partial [Candidatus Limnocylindrales bacterium]